MSGFRSGAYAKVWEVRADKQSNKRASIRVSISEKDKREGHDGEYHQTFSGWIQMLGANCAEKALRIHAGDRIKLGIVDVTNWYDKEKSVTNVAYKCFSFQTMEEAQQEDDLKDTPRATAADYEAFTPIDSMFEGEEDLPF